MAKEKQEPVSISRVGDSTVCTLTFEDGSTEQRNLTADDLKKFQDGFNAKHAANTERVKKLHAKG